MSSSQVKLFTCIDLTCLELIGSSPAISTIARAGKGQHLERRRHESGDSQAVRARQRSVVAVEFRSPSWLWL